jgi:hypothetical protein
MQTEINSQKEFDSIKSKFSYSEYREFSKVYQFNSWCRLKLTGLDIDAAWPGKITDRKKIMAGMETGLTVSLMNGKAKAVKKGAEKDADIFMALKRDFVVLESPRPR